MAKMHEPSFWKRDTYKTQLGRTKISLSNESKGFDQNSFMKYELNSVTSKFILFNFIHDKYNKKTFLLILPIDFLRRNTEMDNTRKSFLLLHLFYISDLIEMNLFRASIRNRSNIFVTCHRSLPFHRTANRSVITEPSRLQLVITGRYRSLSTVAKLYRVLKSNLMYFLN